MNKETKNVYTDDDIVEDSFQSVIISDDAESGDETNVSIEDSYNGDTIEDSFQSSIISESDDERKVSVEVSYNDHTIEDSFISNDGDKHESNSRKNILDSSLEESVLPTPSAKRALNRSTNTPRIIKQIKESKTPLTTNDMFSPRIQPTIIESSSDESNDTDIIDVSHEDDLESFYKSTPSKFISNNTKHQATVESDVPTTSTPDVIITSPQVEVPKHIYEQQQIKVRQLQSDLQKAANVLRTINLNLLPDKGVSLRHRHKTLEQLLESEGKKLSKMAVNKDTAQRKILTWDEIETKAEAVQPKTFGARAMSTYNAQKALTMDRLHQLHGSLKTCPKETELADDPKGLKVELMPHQKSALAWLMFREKQKPSGGILADDMGLGKTLTMISLMLKSKESQEDFDDADTENNLGSTKLTGGTLVVCPASLINQWSSELERRTKRGLASCEMYHGPKRESKPKRLAQYDMVITTYAIVNKECEKDGVIFKVKWRRIILDEAHQIRNHKSQTSAAVCKLSAFSRWALTGTPIQNKELDMFALLKYLRCTPFDDLQVWKRWVGDKSSGGQERLHTVISSLMMRRTKVELVEKGAMLVLPKRNWELVTVELTKTELDVYNRILIFSRKLFAQFLHQRAEKRQDAVDSRYEALEDQNLAPNQEYFMMRQKLLRLNKVKDIKQHEILVLLLRLRQICCHPSLIIGMLHEDMENLGDEDDDGQHQELDLLEQLNKMALNDDVPEAHEDVPTDSEGGGLKEAAKGLLNPNNPVFSKNQISSKIKVMLDVLKSKVLESDDKAIIVSQWPSFLKLIGAQLKCNRVHYDQLDGQVPVSKRMEMVDSFNDPKSQLKVLLLSLTAGGVGLNLVGANHLFLLDVHWNPQLENQAQDRIYRVGQTKPVYVYKFIATDTIEKKILDLQQKKLDIANSMLTGSKQVIVNKLSLDDLKMLFQM